MVRTRYAPSPTGFMTIGNLRSALYEYLIAKHDNGVFIVRIEDTDHNRFVEGAAEAVLETLRLTGLIYDEGPGAGGAYGPYVQSERKESYLPRALELIKKGKAYYCFCSKERLEELDDGYGNTKYDRHCLDLPAEEAEKRVAAGDAYVIRQIIPEGQTTFYDEVFGEITINNKEMEDQILIKSDGMPTYNFANVVDDNAMRITHVARGCEYLTSTPKYKLLYEAFGWDVPVFVHLPLLVNESGQKISKRHGDASIPDFIKQGFLPEAIINYAALLGWSPQNNQEIFTLKELAETFDPKNISKSPSAFDIKKLIWVNSEHIKRMPHKAYYEAALPYLNEAVRKPGIDYKKLAEMTQSRVSFIKDCTELVDFIDCLPEYDIGLYNHKKMKTNPEIAKKALSLAINVFHPVKEWNHLVLYEIACSCAEINNLARSQMLWPIRTALSGKPRSPCGAAEIAELLGRDETLKRLRTGIEKIEAGI